MEPPKADTTPCHLWNPLTEDFSVNYATDDEAPKTYTLPSQTINTFPAYLAHHIAKHLAQHLVLSRGVKTNYEDEYKEALKEITVTL